AVGARRGAAVRVVLLGGLVARDVDRPGPELLAARAVEAEQRPLLSLLGGDGDEDAPVRHDRAAVARAGDLRAPPDVLLRTPLGRRLGSRGDARPERPAELRPVVGEGRSGEEQERGEDGDLHAESLTQARVGPQSLSLVPRGPVGYADPLKEIGMKRWTVAAFLCMAAVGSADTIRLKNGGSLEGVIVKEGDGAVVVRLKYATVTLDRSDIESIEKKAAEDAPAAKALRLPRWDRCIEVVASRPWSGQLRQIPATVIEKGILKNVPYMSHKSGNTEFNLYGDPDEPAGLE